MPDQPEPPDSSRSDGDATLQRDPLMADTASGAGNASSLPLDERTSTAVTEPRVAWFTWRLGSDERTNRRSSWLRSVGALISAALVVTLIGYVLGHLAPARSNPADSPLATPSLTALASVTTAPTTTDTATPASTVTATEASGGSRTSNNGGGVNQPAGPVFAALYSLRDSNNLPAPSGHAFSQNSCGSTFTVNTGYSITLQPPATAFDYYVRHSDGTSDGSAAQPLVKSFAADPTFANTDGGILDNSWAFPYTLATGSPQWLELDITTPDPFTLRVDFSALCTFSPQFPTMAVSPQSYNCAAGGNQTFTYTGNVRAYYAVGSHTITYHWKRFDGSVTPDQTLTFAQGVTSLPAQPDTMVINSSIFPSAPTDELVERGQAGEYQSAVLSPSICFPTPTPVVPTATPVIPTATP